ncbi:MAG: hypothetical protein KZQ83_10530 [gamma proteobacterium symbiont of Taylorina sp.]|nr:hypothetical protein [gamma proteobacterium symbiont of Taylorina sp.]
MEDIEQISNKLLLEIMQMEHEINKIMALNGNKKDRNVKQYQKFIQVKKNKLNKINHNYDDVFDDNQ